MPESKSGALPLGDAAMVWVKMGMKKRAGDSLVSWVMDSVVGVSLPQSARKRADRSPIRRSQGTGNVMGFSPSVSVPLTAPFSSRAKAANRRFAGRHLADCRRLNQRLKRGTYCLQQARPAAANPLDSFGALPKPCVAGSSVRIVRGSQRGRRSFVFLIGRNQNQEGGSVQVNRCFQLA